MSESFRLGRERLAYTVYGDGPRNVVLLHGLLLSQKMHRTLATALAQAGNRVITLDLLGHGHSSHPESTSRYSIHDFAEQVAALLDHLEIPSAVIQGTSLGANVGLEVAVNHPERVQGLIIEMPVLDNALLAAAVAFTPVSMLFTLAPRPLRLLFSPARAVPEGVLPLYLDIGLDFLRHDPTEASRVLNGLLFGRTAPVEEERRTITAPALIIGHRRDPVHPFSDADMLTRELPDARLLEASSILELRFWPERLTAEMAAFIATCWERRAVRRHTA